ncbi:2OG-Fe(II) oxygenase [Paecilomyces variotii No. 5]|uniref:2OG-Fe(II) oxygenase n=1 Tax=Byssochlamys spectabilis (strain No. 5 / NBRC 109023) TaxID=1356009 RepID=V5HQS9_BYSSN|nr:2OG-Fe(II) oxygenase [Paecilomyces variotii No. 5]
MAAEIPLISLSQPRDGLVVAIRTACLSHGFFQVTENPCISASLQAGVLSYMEKFFSQPESLKRTTPKVDHIHGGYETFQRYSLDVARGKPDLNEGFCIAPEFVDDREKEMRDPWPMETENNGLIGFKETAREYYRRADELGRFIGGLIAEGLGLPIGYFEEYFEKQMSHCRLIHYYGQESQKKQEDDIGAGLHTDWGLITILYQDSVGGLEVLDKERGNFIAVPPTDGAYVVNCGDLLSRFTNGVYTSAQHRVKAPPPGVHRYSIPYFCDGNPSYLVDVLPLGAEWKEWVEGRRGKAPEVEKHYQPIKAGVYFESKWTESTLPSNETHASSVVV